MTTRKISELDITTAGPGRALLLELQEDIPKSYRDIGVGEGMFILLLADEVARLRERLRQCEIVCKLTPFNDGGAS